MRKDKKTKLRDPEEMLTKKDLMTLGALQDNVALMKYSRPFHKLSGEKQELVGKLAEKIFYSEKKPVFCGKCNHYHITKEGVGYYPTEECLIPKEGCYSYQGYTVFDTYNPEEKNKNNDCRDFEERTS